MRGKSPRQPAKARAALDVYGALADPTRRVIFERLLDAPSSVGAIAAAMAISQPAVSQHLNVLRTAGCVREQQQGRFRIYSADPAAVERLAQYCNAWSQRARSAQGIPAGACVERDAVDESMERWSLAWRDHDLISVGILVRLHLIHRSIEKLAGRAAARYKLNRIDIQLLGTLDRIGPPHESTLTELSKIMFVSLPGIAKRLRRAETRGLITRRPNSEDGRSNCLRLTEKGRQLLHKVMTHEREHTFAAIYRMPEPQRLHAAQITRELLRALQEQNL